MDTIVVAGDSIFPVKHAPIPFMEQTTVYLNWQMFAMGFAFGIIICLAVLIATTYRRTK